MYWREGERLEQPCEQRSKALSRRAHGTELAGRRHGSARGRDGGAHRSSLWLVAALSGRILASSAKNRSLALQGPGGGAGRFEGAPLPRRQPCLPGLRGQRIPCGQRSHSSESRHVASESSIPEFSARGPARRVR